MFKACTIQLFSRSLRCTEVLVKDRYLASSSSRSPFFYVAVRFDAGTNFIPTFFNALKSLLPILRGTQRRSIIASFSLQFSRTVPPRFKIYFVLRIVTRSSFPAFLNSC